METAGTAPPAVMPPASARLTVTLTRQAARDLQHLQDRTGQDKSDLVNRAISFGQFAYDHLRKGRDLIVRDPATSETQIIRFL